MPPYQRQYQWDRDRWQSLASDITKLSLLEDENFAPHWMGVLLLSKNSPIEFPGISHLKSFEIVDGQQRIATLLIWIAAIQHHAELVGQTINIKIEQITQVQFQLTDMKSIEIILKKKWMMKQNEQFLESQIIKAYLYFRLLLWLGNDALLEEHPLKSPVIKNFNSEESIEDAFEKFSQSANGVNIPRGEIVNCRKLMETTLNKLCIFTIIHEPDKDEPVAAVFDTLNGMRTELEPLDHVRNSLFVRLGNEKGLGLYSNQWKQAEESITDVKVRGSKPGIAFLYDFVISQGEKKRQGTISRMRGSSHFSKMTKDLHDDELIDYILKHLIPAMHVWPVVIRKRDSVRFEGKVIDFELETLQLLDGIQDLSKNPANPIVLIYCVAYLKGELTSTELNSRLRIIESFLGRLVLSMTPMSPLRAKIMDLASDIDKDISEVKLINSLKERGWNSDNKILQIARKAQIGELDARQTGAILRSAERALSGKHFYHFKISPTLYSIEHIYPKKNEKWLKDLKAWGTDVKRMQVHLQTLGNLTAVSKEHNSKVGNKKLSDKQKYPREVGAAAPLKIHQDWLHVQQWTEKEIQTRTEKLALMALKNWSIPTID